jgi:hypothetical protein
VKATEQASAGTMSLLNKRTKKLLFSTEHSWGTRDSMKKVFCFFFSKKKCLPFSSGRQPLDSYHAGR